MARVEFESRCHALLTHGPIAIRSSALGEDSPERSFAGLFTTRLGVTDLPSALGAAGECIASGRTERIRSYTGSDDPAPVGLVVQEMVAARTAGVIFTIDPAGRDPALLIEAVEGLGEGLVAGRLDPEQWRIYRTGDGRVDARSSALPLVLSTREATALASTAWALSSEWGVDLDLEWAMDADGNTWWLQARPITAARVWEPADVQRSAPEADDGPITVWANWNVRETMPDPVTPLTWSVFRSAVVPMLTRDFLGVAADSPAFPHAGAVDRVDGRVYFNMNAMLASPAIGAMLPRFLGVIDAAAAAPTRQLIKDGVLKPRRLPWGPGSRFRGLFGHVNHSLRRLPVLCRPRRALEQVAATGAEIAKRPSVRGLSDEELLTEILLPGSPEIGPIHDTVAFASAVAALWILADSQFRPWPDARRHLAMGLPGNPTTQISIGLDELVELARPLAHAHFEEVENPLESLGAAARANADAARWLTALDRFMASSGHRAPGEFELAVPRWINDPAMIVALVRAALESPPQEPVSARMARMALARDCHIESAIAHAPLWKRPALRALAKAVATYMALREAPKHELMRAYLRARQASIELGERLVRRGLLEGPEDVFFLDVEELKVIVSGQSSMVSGQGERSDGVVECWSHEASARPGLHHSTTPLLHYSASATNNSQFATLSARIAFRREELERFRQRPAPDFVRSDGVPVELAANPQSTTHNSQLVVSGIGVGGGRAEGTVVILAVPDPARLPPGSVLVVRFADPGWTPLFPRAAALVMEVGGAMCHAAVVSRELGIPAVFGARDATHLLPAGARVQVDGDTGEVTILDTDPEGGAF